MHGDEQKWVNDAFDKNWITTAGENINEVERIVAERIGLNMQSRFRVELQRFTWRPNLPEKNYMDRQNQIAELFKATRCFVPI